MTARQAKAQTNAQRQAAFRLRKADNASIEVRGIFANPDDHAVLKEYAKKLARKRTRDKSKG